MQERSLCAVAIAKSGNEREEDRGQDGGKMGQPGGLGPAGSHRLVLGNSNSLNPFFQ